MTLRDLQNSSSKEPSKTADYVQVFKGRNFGAVGTGRTQIKGSGIGTSATRAEIVKKLVSNKYIALNKKTQIVTPTLTGEMIVNVVSASIGSLLNPTLTASWEKGLTYVAEGSVTEEEYMQKLDKFVTQKTNIVKQNNFQYQLRQSFDQIAPYYQKKK